MMRGLLVAIGFLTRIPVPSCAFDDAAGRARSLAWYPLVGAFIGAFIGATLGALAWALPGAKSLLVAAIVLVAWVAITGALHLDGLADSSDAWIGGMGGTWDERRARTLAIMKDPRCGPAGVTALVLLLLLKFAALASAAAGAWAWLWLAPLLARTVAMMAFMGTPYVRSGGLGSGLADAPRIGCVVTLTCAIAACALAGTRGALALVIAVAVLLAWRRACMRRLGGITGDTAGALIELVEAAVLVGVALYPDA